MLEQIKENQLLSFKASHATVPKRILLQATFCIFKLG
jgi:hypothetical protein